MRRGGHLFLGWEESEELEDWLIESVKVDRMEKSASRESAFSAPVAMVVGVVVGIGQVAVDIVPDGLVVGMILVDSVHILWKLAEVKIEYVQAVFAMFVTDLTDWDS